MLTLLFASQLLIARQQAQPPTAAELISKMFARYASAKTLAGTIKTTQTAGSASVVTDTHLVYERPSKIRLDQKQVGREIRRDGTIISDGTSFTYRPPNRVLASAPWLMEPVQPEGRKAQTLGDIYLVVAADLPDRSPVLDALIARPDDLQYFANQLASFKIAGRINVGGKDATVIEGAWRETNLRNQGDVRVNVNEAGVLRDGFKLYISDAGDLVRYELTQRFASPAVNSARGKPQIGAEQVTVTTVWEVSVAIDAPIDPARFALKV